MLGIEIILMLFKIFYIEHAKTGTAVFLLSMLFSFLIIRKQKITIDLMVLITILGSIILGLIL